MPAFVQWQWKEKSKTYLVIFYFFDDSIKKNLRFRFRTITKTGKMIMLEEPTNNPDAQPQQIMTWAPTHVEIALLGDVLRFANIIDGLDVQEKLVLREKLEIQSSEKDRYVIDATADWEDFFEGIPGVPMIAFVGSDDWFLASEVCSGYIDYLTEILKPFIKD